MTAEHLGLEHYLAALQCERRLWRARRATGASQLGRWLASRRDLGGALEALAPEALPVEGALSPVQAAEATVAALAQGAGLIRGAAFQSGAWAERVDLVERVDRGALALHLLVADTAVREVDLDRAAFLAFLIEASERLARVELWCLDREYRGQSAAPDWRSLIKRRDVTRDVRFLKGDVVSRLVGVAPVLAREIEPEVEPSPHCWRPVRCEFWSACTASLPEGALAWLPRLRPDQFHALRERGTERIAEIPEDTPLLEPIQRRAREAWRVGGAVCTPDLAERLRALGPALAFLDFEAAVSAVPLLDRCAPFEPIPVQWSLLMHDEHGKRAEAEFLAPAGEDPRLAFAQSLCEALAQWSAPIAVYSDFEAKVLAALETLCPAWSSELARIRSRLTDFLPMMRECVAHPGFRGSFSLKRVAPVLAPEIRYDDLSGVASGAEAADALRSWILGELDAAERERLSSALFRYCRRDVEALQALHTALCTLAEPPRDP